MASLALLNGSENLMNSYLVAASNGNLQMLHNSPPTVEHSQMMNTQRIAPKIENHQRYSHHHPESPDLLRCKRRIQLGHLPPPSGKGTGPQPPAVARRNERERNRVRLVNLGFATLRQHVPSSTKNKKMSKVDTLRSAVDYIKRLQELLGEASSDSPMSHQGLDENSYPVGGQSSTGSPTPSMCSEASSPYDNLQGDEDDDLMEFASWF